MVCVSVFDYAGKRHRVGVVYRRLSDEYLDPFAFNPDSVIGVPPCWSHRALYRRIVGWRGVPRTLGWRCIMTSVGLGLFRHTTVWSTTTTSPSPMAAITATACSTSASSPAATSSRTSGSTLPCTSRDTDSPTFSRCRIPYFGRCKADKQKRPKRHCFNLHCMRIRRDSNSRRGSPSHAFEACSLDRSDTYPFVT